MRAPIWFLLFAATVWAEEMSIRVRTRLDGNEAHVTRVIPVNRAAALLCDMWDNHWCRGAAQRVDEMAPRMNAFIEKLRAADIPIVHSPSDVMDFYKDYPQRKLMIALTRADPPPPLERPDPPLPIDDSDGGCDTDDKTHKAWKRQHAAIRIAPQDMISDNGLEVYSFLRARGIDNLFIMGVHTNMCVLNRRFAIKQMTRWGINCILVRDMTDAMYDPKDRPYVSHQKGTELVIRYIERYWAPSILSAELIAALPKK
jgi:nicotinamidase-related amidase